MFASRESLFMVFCVVPHTPILSGIFVFFSVCVLLCLAAVTKGGGCVCCQDQFRNAPPVQGGIGMHLLQKMGWKPGDGLGKDNEGNKEPLMLDIKTDRKGLSTSLDHRPMQPMVRPPPPGIRPPASGNGPGIFPGAVAPVPQRAKDLSGKHPVSALTELCTKRRWGPPAFEVVNETGPAHKRMFLFKVRVNGVEYQPTAACGNKKLAKAQSAAVCLQEMGLIPRDFVVQV